MIYLVTQTLNGLFSAALLFLIASGLTLVFGVMRTVNIAHGSFYMLGVYVAWTVITRTHADGTYTLWFVIPGGYAVRVTPPDTTLVSSPDSILVVVNNNEDVVDVDFTIDSIP